LRAQDAGVRICAGGDVTLGTNLDTLWARTAARKLQQDYGVSAHPRALVAPLRPLLADADVVLLNVEGAIGDGYVAERKCSAPSANCYAFRQPTAAARALREVAPDAVVVGNVANNHSRDAGPAGFGQTMRHLRRAGVYVTGADTLATRVVAPTGDTIAVLGFYTSDDPLVPDARNLDAVYRHVARAVARYGTVVVTAHIGAEGVDAQRTRNETEIFLGKIDRGNPVAFADTALAAGATMVIGHGPHVMRGMEFYRGHLIAYSLGNFAGYRSLAYTGVVGVGGILKVGLRKDGSYASGTLVASHMVAPGLPALDPQQQALPLVRGLSDTDFPSSGARIGPDGAISPR
jgi:poly-gamma-glutamate capsule biosynthesis protein CapA/YwtB (metallophosphatase superfamily)